MHSAEPFDRSVKHPSQPLADESWRAEVASRVHSYRARRKSKPSEEDSLALDFGPASAAGEPFVGPYPSQSPASASANPEPQLDPAAEGAGMGDSGKGAEARNAARSAFDTNYYRRLNAQSREQSSMTIGATAVATAAAEEMEIDCTAVDEASECAISSEEDDRELPDSGQEAGSLSIDLELRPAVTGDACLDRYRISEVAPETLFEAASAPCGAAPVAAPVLPPQGNLIVFPRALLEPPLLPQPSRDELAEPVHNRPRILEVPEDIMPAVQASLFPAIRLDGDEPESCGLPEPAIEVPLPVAPVSARFTASLADLGMVMAAGALFAVIACYSLPGVPRTKPFWMGIGVVTMLLWAIYQCLFLLYAGRTVGMRMTGIHLSTFDGRAPEWTERGRRARFILISFASVALGFLWALVDEDTLCWHDRISQTFPTAD
jgi:uncharacterized RDD family membrane protein YckC